MTDRELEPNVPFETGLVRSEARFPGVSLHKDNQLSQEPSGSQPLEEADMGGCLALVTFRGTETGPQITQPEFPRSVILTPTR